MILDEDRLNFSYDEHFMKLALEESFKALPDAIPNPPVGCVLVKDNAIIARGFTHSPGNYHAEAHAMSQVHGELSEVTAYVTLEPCSFHGRTPSCALALVERKTQRVVISIMDPDPRNSGRGIEILKRAGVSVHVDVLVEPVRRFIMPYLNIPANHPSDCSCYQP